ncbi:MAG: hypothetical protein AAF564_00920 [Bacteroidota bacterium]
MLGLSFSGYLPARQASAQIPLSFYDYARPELKWYNIETEHFNIIFHADEQGQGSGRTAQVVARIAEDVYGPITSLYDLEPDTKVAIILKDYEDYSNGAAYFFDNKIEIWSPSLDAPLRGDHNWLRNVITHEFTHIVQVQKSMKANRRLPFIYFQLLDYENVRRPDVLYGYPNVIVTYPITTLNNPAWLAEGTAQYQREWLNYDSWDSHRDMLLRTRMLEGEQLSLEDMGGFYSHNSLLRETVYNQGFAFTHYLAKRFGEETLMEVSAALGKWENWNVERAIKDATGVPGGQVYQDWVQEMRHAYTESTHDLRQNLVEGDMLEPAGFSNFYPHFSPTGDRVAYVSNKGKDFNLLSLYIKDLESGKLTSLDLKDVEAAPLLTHTCAFGHKVKSGVGRAYTWHPGGQKMTYVRRKDTAEGYLYADLYEIDLETKKSKRLTTRQRATAPVYNPAGDKIAFVGQLDGSTNLFVLDASSDSIRQLTTYNDGTQVTDPVWHPGGDVLYYGLQHSVGRDIYRIAADGRGVAEGVLRTKHDERSPAFDEAGTLYFSSDKTGIFNIYKLDLDADAAPEQVTNVLGGAFMPDVRNNRLVYAHYDYDGYKIGYFDELPAATPSAATMAYTPPAAILKDATAFTAAPEALQLNAFNDTDLKGPSVTEIQGEAPASESFEITPYKNQFTSWSIYPVLRLDQYVSRRQQSLDVRLADRGRLETLLRNTKVGVLASSREILEGLSIFGGVMVGLTSRDASSVGDFFSPSRLLKLERDVFFQFDYSKGLGLLPKRWSPQISLEVFNIRRNVDKGLSIEEFPCTACLPDTTLANLSYNLWEASVTARSKITRFAMLEAGYRYSPYSVTTERFFSKEFDGFVDDFTSKYYIGSTFQFAGYLEWFAPHRHSNVIPNGLRVEARFEREIGRLLDRFDLEDGILEPIYERHRVHRLSLDTKFSMVLPGQIMNAPHGLGLRARGSTILGKTVDDFFNDYVGGLVGARGYPFYALGGNETLWLQASYTLPLIPRINKQFMFAYFDKLYGRVYTDFSAAWNGGLGDMGALRQDVGAELRLGMGSFYLLPTALFVSATYGLDAFDFQLDEGFLTPTGENTVRYGQSLQWHFGVLFGFDL